MNPKSSVFSLLYRRKQVFCSSKEIRALLFWVSQKILVQTLCILQPIDWLLMTPKGRDRGWFCCPTYQRLFICPQLWDLHTVRTCWHFWRSRELNLLCLVPGSVNKPSPDCSSLQAVHSVQWYHSFFKAQRLFAQVHETFTDSMTLLFRHWNWFLPALSYSMGSNE